MRSFHDKNLELFCTYAPENLRALKPGADCNALPWINGYPGKELELIASFLPENPNILEAGAHYGQDTKVMAKRWPKGKIFAFEPTPFSFSRLAQNTSELQNVKIFSLALFSQSEFRTFYIAVADGQASSLFHGNHLFPNDRDVPIRVRCVRLDEWAQSDQVDHIDYMWLDMEGAELEMFKGASKILKTVKAISLELSFIEGRNGMALFPEILAFLEQSGFSLYKIFRLTGGTCPKGYEITGFPQATGIFIRTELLESS